MNLRQRGVPVRTHEKLVTEDLMNPKQYRSVAAMRHDRARVHQVLASRYSKVVDDTIQGDILRWHDVWLLLDFVRILRCQPRIDFRRFMFGVRLRLPTEGERRYGYIMQRNKVLNYLATLRPYFMYGYAVQLQPTDDLRVVEVEFVW